MSEILKTDMVELFRYNSHKYLIGDTKSVTFRIENNSLTYDNYEEILNLTLANKCYIKPSDYTQMYDLFQYITQIEDKDNN